MGVGDGVCSGVGLGVGVGAGVGVDGGGVGVGVGDEKSSLPSSKSIVSEEKTPPVKVETSVEVGAAAEEEAAVVGEGVGLDAIDWFSLR